MHPLLNNISNLNDDELHKKLAELNKRFMHVYRFGPGEVLPQLQMLIDDYNAEISKRNANKMKEMQEKLDRSTKKDDGKGLKSIIDIQ